MGKHIGELYKGIRGIVYYRLSPMELKALGGFFTHGPANAFRRFRESVLYVAPRKL